MELPFDVLNIIYGFCDEHTRSIFTFSNSYWKNRSCTILDIYYHALDKRNTNLLVWTLEFYTGTESPPKFTSKLFEQMVSNYNYDMLEILYKFNCPYNCQCFNITAQVGSIEMLEWGINHGYALDLNICDKVTDTETLEWLRSRQFPITFNGLKHAIDNYVNELRQYPRILEIGDNLRELVLCVHNMSQDKYLDTNILDHVIVKGNLELIIMIHDLGYKFTNSSMKMAVNMERLDIIKYLFENGCTLNNVVIPIIKTSNIPIIKWTLENAKQIPTFITQYTSNRKVINLLRSYGYK